MTDQGRTQRPRKFMLPRGACDAHLHIYGPFDQFPLAPNASHRIGEHMKLEDYVAVMDELGLERAVVVTGSGNGTQNDVTLDAIARMNGRFKGVALLDPQVTETELRRLTEGGIVAFRMRASGKGAPGFADARLISDKVRDLGWHVEYHVASVEDAVAALPQLRAMKLPYVLDHVAHLGPERRLDGELERRLLDVFRDDENCWINLYSFYQRSRSGGPGYADMIPIVRELLDRAPDRLVWGTNWPHVVIEVAAPENVDLLAFVFDAVPEDNLRNAIFATNPARLYGWAQGS